GDLDWITLKAVRREREERYASASALADDIERHLAGRPVHAGPPSLAYRLRKLVRRQRPVVLTACVAVAVVAIGLGMARWRTRSADRLARTRQMQARSAVGRLLQRANDATMHRTPQNQALRRELAADALKFYDAWLADQPLDPGLRAGRCRALITLAEIHVVLGQVRQAILTADRARTDAAALLARTPDDVALRALSAGATRMRIKAMLFERRFAESLPYCESTVAELERCAAADLREHGMSLARSLRELALTKKMLGDPAAAVAAGRRSIAILEQLVASDANADAARQDLVWARFTLAEQLTSGRRFDAAERLLAAAAADLDRITVGREQISAAVYGQLGEVAWQRRDLAAAIRHLTRAQQACDAWLAREPNHVRAHGTLFECLRRLARACEFHGDLPRASAAMQRAIDVAAAKAAAFPEDPGRISDERGALYEFARAHWNRFRRRELALARPWLQRCVGLCAAAATAGGSQRPLFWESRSVQLLVDDADGRDTAAAWEELAAELPRQRELGPEELAQQVVEGWLGLTRSRLARGDRVGAAGALRSAGFYLGDSARVDSRTRSEVAFWRARIAIASGDIDAARNSVIELTRHRKSWWGHWRAGDCELDVWQALARRSAPPSAILAARDRAAAHFRHVTESLGERVASAPNDPRVAVPFGLAAIGLAQCEIDRGERDHARARLTDALATLARVEAEAFRDLWDATRVRTGHELLRRLGAPPR
ncbi:MAG: hypothetical protein KDC87_00760, partial [Planctomycetes bacterium]|nr:hypothetical protein [Planctomycetota bacterium]